MYNNTNYPFIPDPNLININNSQKISQLEQNINKLDRELKRLEHRVMILENNKYSYMSTQNNKNSDDDGMYMM